MKRFSLSHAAMAATVALIAATATAAPITPEQALAAARAATQSAAHRAPVAAQLSLAYQAQNETAQLADYYVFNYDNQAGYIIIAADDQVSPVLGYVDNGNFDINNIPDNMRAWLQGYQDELNHIRSHSQEPRRAQTLTTSVAPLLRTLWNQSAPYNNQCPTYTLNNETYPTYTGCVATATAQIMNHHKWPQSGTGSHSYTNNVGGAGNQTISRDFAHAYNWDLMLNSYTESSPTANINAVATLMADIGCAVEMNYKSDASGAASHNVPAALKTYFGYDADMTIISRNAFSINEWESILRAELDARRPVYYSGSATSGGHAFVVDGYNSDGMFHINWGWGGNSDGYFVTTMLNPKDQGIGSFEGGYNNTQQAVIGIQREDNVTNTLVEPYCHFTQLIPQVSSVTLGSSAPIQFYRAGLEGAETYEHLYWGFALYNEEETEMIQGAYSVNATGIEAGGLYSATSGFTPNSDLTPGKYHLYAIYTSDIFNSQTRFMRSPAGKAEYILVTVQGNTAYFSTPEADYDLQLNGEQISSSVVYLNRPFRATFRIKNNGTEEFCDNVHARLVPTSGSTSQSFTEVQLDIPAGETFTYKAILTPQSLTTDQSYNVCLYHGDTQIGILGAVTLRAEPTFEMSIVSDVTTAASEMRADQLEFTATLKTTSGIFSGQIELFIINEASRKIVKRIYSDCFRLNSGSQKTITFADAFGGEVGQTYTACLRNPHAEYANVNKLWSSGTTFTVIAPEEPAVRGDVNGDGAVNIADINIMTNVILGIYSKADYPAADLNNNGEVEISDLNLLINIVLDNQ